jgi:hypothetical protein
MIDKIKVTSEELFFLASILGSSNFVGLEDVFEGELIENIKTKWEIMEPELLEKGILVPTNEEISVSDDIFELLYPCCFTNRVLWVFDNKKEYYLYFMSSSVIKKTQNTNTHTLERIGTPQEVIHNIIQELSIENNMEIEDYKLHIPKSTFNLLQSNQKESHLLLEELGASNEVSMILANIFQSRQLEKHYVMMKYIEDDWLTENIGFIKGINSTVRFRSYMNNENQEFIELSIHNPKKTQEDLYNLFSNYYLPEGSIENGKNTN